MIVGHEISLNICQLELYYSFFREFRFFGGRGHPVGVVFLKDRFGISIVFSTSRFDLLSSFCSDFVM